MSFWVQGATQKEAPQRFKSEISSYGRRASVCQMSERRGHRVNCRGVNGGVADYGRGDDRRLGWVVASAGRKGSGSPGGLFGRVLRFLVSVGCGGGSAFCDASGGELGEDASQAAPSPVAGRRTDRRGRFKIGLQDGIPAPLGAGHNRTGQAAPPAPPVCGDR